MLLAQREDDIRNFVPKTNYELETLYKEGFSGVLFDEEGNVHHVITNVRDITELISLNKNPMPMIF